MLLTPPSADPGSVRGQYAVSVGRNLIHASDSFDAATKEIGLWFTEKELPEYSEFLTFPSLSTPPWPLCVQQQQN